MLIFFKKFWKDIAIFALIAACLCYMHLSNGLNTDGELWFYDFFSFILFDTAVLLLGTYIVSLGHKKIAYSLAFALSLSWTLLNVFYYRFFNQYFNFRDFSEAQNLKGSVVWRSVFSAIQLSDIFLLAALILFISIITRTKPSRVTFFERAKLLMVFMALPLISTSIYGTTHAVMEAILAIRNSEEKAQRLQSWDYLYLHKKNTQHRGVFCGQLYDDIIVKREDRLLTEKDRLFVEQHCEELCDEGNYNGGGLKDSTSKNIVFILIESALSYPIGKIIDGVEITPNINALLQEPKTFYNGMCESNISLGQSFDGQFIYHTGLLPLFGKLTPTSVVNNELKAFPSFLKEKYGIQNAIMAIPTGPSMWRQDEMCLLYGYDKLLSTATIGVKNPYVDLNDSLVVDLLINNEEEILSQKPFLHTILTMSMHNPYDVAKYDIEMPTLSSYPLQMNNYLKHYHYTDRQIGRYLQFLKSKGLYENSIIIIASDHDIPARYLNMKKEDVDNQQLPFIIAHAGIDPEECWQGEMNQLDVFTTLLDLLNLETDWYGLGSSVLNKENYKNRLNETTQKVSDLIIESNYWKSKP